MTPAHYIHPLGGREGPLIKWVCVGMGPPLGTQLPCTSLSGKVINLQRGGPLAPKSGVWGWLARWIGGWGVHLSRGARRAQAPLPCNKSLLPLPLSSTPPKVAFYRKSGKERGSRGGAKRTRPIMQEGQKVHVGRIIYAYAWPGSCVRFGIYDFRQRGLVLWTFYESLCSPIWGAVHF